MSPATFVDCSESVPELTVAHRYFQMCQETLSDGEAALEVLRPHCFKW